jgi:thymidylate synthase
MDDALRSLSAQLIDEGSVVKPRGLLTKELLNVGFELTIPTARVIYSKRRRWNPSLAVGEFFWHLAAQDDAAFIAYYAPAWLNFASNGRVAGSCYGKKLFGTSEGISQWDKLKRTLTTDPATRRAIISFSDNDADVNGAPDVACACSLQFFIRDSRLHLTTYMRSNDLIWGTCYDVFTFTLFQEMMARELDLQLGTYFHFVGSLHIYERHWNLAEALSCDEFDRGPAMPRMPTSPDRELLLRHESDLRRNGPKLTLPDAEPYWNDMLLLLAIHAAKRGDMPDIEAEARDKIGWSHFKRVLAD